MLSWGEISAGVAGVLLFFLGGFVAAFQQVGPDGYQQESLAYHEASVALPKVFDEGLLTTSTVGVFDDVVATLSIRVRHTDDLKIVWGADPDAPAVTVQFYGDEPTPWTRQVEGVGEVLYTVARLDPPVLVKPTVDSFRVDELFLRIADLETRLRALEKKMAALGSLPTLPEDTTYILLDTSVRAGAPVVEEGGLFDEK